MTTNRVLCQATVEPGESMLLRANDHASTWLVTVTGLAPHDERRVYRIASNSDTQAVQEGFRRFMAEMEQRDVTRPGTAEDT